ncbi:MAG: hypothetical protein M9962_11700, partial [Oligoflexia bacterium]|nr:hypothetical protein [Oligoflexia bacterium]
FVLLVQLVFILVSLKKDKHKFIKKWVYWLLPAGIFLALWLPIFYEALQTKLLSCCNEKISFYYYLMGIGHVLSLSHFDMNILGSNGTVFTSPLYLLVIPMQFIILLFFLRGNKNNEKILLLLSASMPLLILLAIDIALGWKRALVPRFLYLTILSFWIINYIWLYSNLFKSNLKKKFIGILFGFFLFFGLLSFQKKYQQEVIWWHKNTQYRIVQLANLLKDTKYQKLVVKKELINFYFVVTLSKILERPVAIEWVTDHTDTRLRDAIYLGFEKSNLPNLVYTSSLEVSLEYMP